MMAGKDFSETAPPRRLQKDSLTCAMLSRSAPPCAGTRFLFPVVLGGGSPCWDF
ncbi:hypothetical protein LaLC_57680 [Bacillus anthracis]|uniref:Uncharacterized protein n=1 Tax=Bacillus anthracis TaxID=1392 RepID=A0A640MP87_BACAN|nr:hypothetical protein LaLC_57680 [Bacillus anthracis]